jgi:hypothetical protein
MRHPTGARHLFGVYLCGAHQSCVGAQRLLLMLRPFDVRQIDYVASECRRGRQTRFRRSPRVRGRAHCEHADGDADAKTVR